MSTRPTARHSGASPEEEAQILDTIDRWVEKEVRPIARKFDQADEYPAGLVEQMKELGLFGATIGPEWGGLGLSASTYAKVVARISQVWMAPTGIFNSHLIMAACVERNGTPVGLTNLDHEPPTFHGVERPNVDRFILPTTWRESGAGILSDPLQTVSAINCALLQD